MALSGDLSAEFHAVRHSRSGFYRSTQLFYKNRDGKFLLYKPAGEILPEEHNHQHRHPLLYIHEKEWISSIKELQNSFLEDLKYKIKGTNPLEVKTILNNIVEDSFSAPKQGTLGELKNMVKFLLSSYQEHNTLLKKIPFVTDTRYSVVHHSVNVMILSLLFSDYAGLTHQEKYLFMMMGLLHDIGKSEIPPEILESPGKLTPEEFIIMKTHAKKGAEIILADPQIEDEIAVGALEHHERMDGSGYPNRLKEISFAGRLIALLDSFEVLTGDERPYRRARKPLETLALLKNDVVNGKLDKEIFTIFCRSLV